MSACRDCVVFLMRGALSPRALPPARRRHWRARFVKSWSRFVVPTRETRHRRVTNAVDDFRHVTGAHSDPPVHGRWGMGASDEAVAAPGETMRTSSAGEETAAKAPPDSASGPETAHIDAAAARLVLSSDAASARSPAPTSPSRASINPPASPSRHASASVQELLGMRRLVDDGTPLTSAQARRAESLVKEAVGDGFRGNEFDASRLRLTSSELESLGLSAPPKPELPPHFDRLPLPRRLRAAQAFIDALTYNHVAQPSTFFSVDKRRPVGRILETARRIERDALPIKCVEAVFLALRLTHDWRDVDRIPMAFKTAVAFTDGAGLARRRCHRHIVLLIRRRRGSREPESDAASGPGYGALGISRRASLAHRPMRYTSVSEILTSYRDAYRTLGHAVLKVRVGLPAPREPPEAEVCWRHCCVAVGAESRAEVGAGEGPRRGADLGDHDDDADEAASAENVDAAEVDRAADAATDPAFRTWEEAMAVFEAHDAASRSRGMYDTWRADGKRFACVAPDAEVPVRGAPSAGTPPSAPAARERERREPPAAGTGEARTKRDDARGESSPAADDGADAASGAATGGNTSRGAKVLGAEPSAEPRNEP